MAKHNLTCTKCSEDFIYKPEEAFFDDHGFGYSTKLVKCPYCGQINIIKYYEDRSMKLNRDSRYYNYERKSYIQ